MKRFFSNVRFDLLAAGLLLLFILLFLHRALAPDMVLLPLDVVTQLWAPWRQPNQPVVTHNEVIMDVVNYIYPAKEFMAESIRNGSLPLWNPYSFTGYPFIYNTQAGMFYPLSVFYYFLPTPTAVDLTIISQLVLAAWFMFLYLRRIKLKQLAALIGAATFVFNGLTVVWLEWQAVHAAFIWLPAQLYFVERIAEKLVDDVGKRQLVPLSREVIGLGLLVGIPWLGGHWSWTLYGSMTVAIYMLARLGVLKLGWVLLRRQARWRPSTAIPLVVTAGSLMIGIGISLVQVAPAFNYLSQTHRDAISIGESMREGLFNRGVVAFVPNFFGNPIHDNWWGPWSSNFVETTFYGGILTLLLACLALFMRRDFHTRFFSVWGGVTLLWALGSPAYFVLYILPVFNGIQPSRAAFLVTFCLAILAALAVDALMESTIEHRRLVATATWCFAGLFVLITVAYFTYYRADVARTWDYLQPNVTRFGIFLLSALFLTLLRVRALIRPQLFGWLALLLIVSDLFIFGYNFNPVSDIADLYPETPASTFLQADDELYRISPPAEGWAFLPNTSHLFRIPSLSGYEPGVLDRVNNLLAVAEGESMIRFNRVVLPLNGLDSPLLDMLNVKYITTMNDYWHEAPEVGASQASVATWLPLPAEQILTISDAGLQRVDLPLQSTGSGAGTVTVRILSADGTFEFANAQLQTAEIENDAWHSFYLMPFPSTWGRAFRLRVEYVGEANGITVGANERNELAYAAYYLPRPNLVFEEGQTRIYLNEGYFPRAFIVPQAAIVANEAEALAAVSANQNRLREIVFLELDGEPLPPTLTTAASPNTPVTVESYELNSVELAVKLAEPGFLVLADTYYSGWRAWIGEEEVPLYRANSLLRAVYVPAGDQRITFRFMPLDFVVGSTVSLTTLLSSFAILLLGIYWQRRRL